MIKYIKKAQFKLLSIMVYTFILSGCFSNTDDPTNIEHEVLRASLLEKELKIDELLKTIDQNSARLNQLEASNQQLLEAFDKSEKNLETLLMSKNIIFTLNETRDNFYQVLNDTLYISSVYDDQELGLHQEIVNVYQADLPKVELYRGTKVTFFVDDVKKQLVLLDENNLYILETDGKIKYKADIDINNPQVDLNPSLIINQNKTADYGIVLLTRDTRTPSDATKTNIKKDISRLLSVVYFDFANDTQQEPFIFYFDTNEYIIFSEQKKMAYVTTKNDNATLEILDFSNQTVVELQSNSILPIDLRWENNVLYYQNDENLESTFIP